MKRLQPVASWALHERDLVRPIDERVLPLVRAIAQGGSLAAAARALGVPYRTAWGVLEAAEQAVGFPLIASAQGRGAAPTAAALRWLSVDSDAAQVLEESALALDLPTVASKADRGRVPLLRIVASHDIALAQLKDRWRIAHRIALEFQGSAASLDAYRSNRAQIAGFHVAPVARGEPEPLLVMLDYRRDAVLRFLTRSQGLIVARGNPRHLQGLADLAGKRLTIVNRQPGSGTRVLLDRLLARAGIAAESIAGYSNEEFTHAAVAATVASGRADAGFGIRAAAAQFGLGFVPVATEKYLFACARRALESPRIVLFRELLASRATREVVQPLPGYSLDAPGKLQVLRRG